MKMSTVIAVCLLLFAAIVALDILTPQRLVAAILLNIPVGYPVGRHSHAADVGKGLPTYAGSITNSGWSN